MPLLDFKQLDTPAKIAIWNITESMETMQNLLRTSGLENDIPESGAEQHQLQKTTVKYLIFKILGIKETLRYDTHGKPLLPENLKGHISISHSKHMVAIMYAEQHLVGIDLELIQDKIHKIYSRFTQAAELPVMPHDALRTEQLYAYWCAKEAVYKLYGKKGVSLRDDIFISPFEYRDHGGVMAVNMLPANWKLTVNYLTIANYMLAYTTI